MDRQVLSILAPTLQRELTWSESQYAAVVYSFTLVYAFGFLIAGRWLDRVGVRRGFATAVILWSVAAMSTAFAHTTAAFAAARGMLGLGESANFPGAIKSVGQWFPKEERALATGIFNAGTNTGAIVTPLIVPLIALNWGWRWAFVVTGSLGFLWLFLWLALYRSPSHAAQTPSRAPRLFGQRVYARERHVPAERRGVRLRHRGLRRRDGRPAVPVADRAHSRRDGEQLCVDIRGVRIRVHHRLDPHSHSRAAARTG